MVAEEPPAGDSGVNRATLLRVLVRERHWQKFQTFEVQFRRAARDLAQREGEPALGSVTVSARSWDRWLSGNVKTEPRPDTCRVLEHMFGHPVRELLVPAAQAPAAQAPASQASGAQTWEQARTTTGAWPGGPGVDQPVADQAVTIDVTASCSSAADPLDGALVAGPARDGSWDVNEVERRELLRLLSGIAVAAPFMGGVDKPRRDLDSALNAPTTAADVTEWERVATQYSTESGLVPPAVLLRELLTDLDEAQLRLKYSSERLRDPMARVCGRLSELAAINFYNAGDERNAARYWRTAMRVMTYTSDRQARAGIYGYRAVFASPAIALALADDAIGIADGRPCVGAAWGHQARAMALAQLGEHHESTRALQDLTDTFTGLPRSETSPSQMYGERALRYTECGVHAYAGRSADAAKSQEAGRALVPDGYWLPYADLELRGAMCLVLGGDPSEGARRVVRTVEALPVGFQSSLVVRQSAARALDLVPVAAASTPAVSQARELLSLPASPAR